MEVTSVKIYIPRTTDDRFLAYASLVFDDCFILYNAKVMQSRGRDAFVAMPSRPLTDVCTQCDRSNTIQASFCNWCGRQLDPERFALDREGVAIRDDRNGSRKVYDSICHPLTEGMREMIEHRVRHEYNLAARRVPPARGMTR